jgi:hypothetical protein
VLGLYRCIDAPILFGQRPSLSAHEGESMLRTYLVCREKQERQREREREKQIARAKSTQCTNNSDSIASTSELLLWQNSVAEHAHQSQAHQLASDHCATEIHRPKSAVRPKHSFHIVSLVKWNRINHRVVRGCLLSLTNY